MLKICLLSDDTETPEDDPNDTAAVIDTGDESADPTPPADGDAPIAAEEPPADDTPAPAAPIDPDLLDTEQAYKNTQKAQTDREMNAAVAAQ